MLTDYYIMVLGINRHCKIKIQKTDYENTMACSCVIFSSDMIYSLLSNEKTLTTKEPLKFDPKFTRA